MAVAAGMSLGKETKTEAEKVQEAKDHAEALAAVEKEESEVSWCSTDFSGFVPRLETIWAYLSL